MKTTVLIVTLVTLTIKVLADPPHYTMKQKFSAEEDQCLKENSLNFEEIQESWKMDKVPNSVACFHRCVAQKKGLIDENGAIQKDVVEDMIKMPDASDAERNRAIECLLGIDSIATCEDSAKIFACFPDDDH